MLRFKVGLLIRHVRNTEGGPFLMLRIEVRPFIRHVRNTEGRPFLTLFIDMLEIQRWDHFLAFY